MQPRSVSRPTLLPWRCSRYSAASVGPKPAYSVRERIATARLFGLGADLAIGGAAARGMNDGMVALFAQPDQQPPELPFAEADLLGGLLLGDEFLVGFLQRHQPVALSLCHQ